MSCRILLSLCIILLGCSAQPAGEQENIPDRAQKDLLIEIAGRVYARELTSGTGGDISVRVPGTDRIVVKATGTCLGDLDYGKLSTIGLDGEVIGGNPAPSHEARIHAAIYSLREEVGAIMHMHSPYATAWAVAGMKIPAVTQQSVSLLAGLALVPYYRVGSQELDRAVAQAYANPETQVVMMQNHGVFVVGKDLYDLLYRGEVVENTARVAWLCKALGPAAGFEF
ncbi:MAG: class II aldolase/adducin family protein [Candidatus Glassbacteria bacterium]|nr:class II aldolase/adducin family protein [Candidatus Glassbacteria bacterium]